MIYIIRVPSILLLESNNNSKNWLLSVIVDQHLSKSYVSYLDIHSNNNIMPLLIRSNNIVD